MIQVCTGKIHRATVTEADLDYEGSITLCQDLMTAAGISPFQLVHINGLRNAAHWETYVLPGEAGVVCLNGPPAHLFEPGDLVVINAWSFIEPGEARLPWLRNRTVFVDERNGIKLVRRTQLAAPTLDT